MTDLKTLARQRAREDASRLADLVLDVAVPAMAAMLTIGLFLLVLR